MNQLTPKQFAAAIKYAKEKQLHHQLHLASIDASYIHNGAVVLGYDPFPGNWLLTTFVRLAKIPFDCI